MHNTPNPWNVKFVQKKVEFFAWDYEGEANVYIPTPMCFTQLFYYLLLLYAIFQFVPAN